MEAMGVSKLGYAGGRVDGAPVDARRVRVVLLVSVGSPPARQKVFLVEGNVKEEQNA